MSPRLAPAGLLLAGLLVLCTAVYLPGLSGPLVLDDYAELGTFLDADRFERASAGELLISPSGPLGRPASRATFWLQVTMGGAGASAWKSFNLALHLLNAVLVYWLGRRLFQAGGVAGDARLPALALAGLWLLHPLHTSTVLYAAQRMTLLSALFVLLGMNAYLAGRFRGGVAGRWLLVLALGACFPLAGLSKETGLLLPVYLLLLESTVVGGQVPPGRSRRVYGLLIGILAAGLVLLLALVQAGLLDSPLAGYTEREYGPGARLLTQTRAVGAYLLMLLAPLPQLMGFFHDDVTISSSLAEPPTTAAALLVLLGMLLGAWSLLRRAPLVALGTLLFFAGHLMESTVLPLEPMFEHRNYLPALGLLLALVALVRHSEPLRRHGASLAVALIVLLAGLSVLRAQIWSDELRLYEHAVAVHPESRRAVAELADIYAASGAVAQARRLLAGRGWLGARLQRLYLQCRSTGRLWDADFRHMAEQDMPARLSEQAVTGLIELANLGLDGRCDIDPLAFTQMLQASVQGPAMRGFLRQRLLMYLAHYRHRLGQDGAALRALEQASIEGEPSPVPLFLASEWMLDAGDAGAARDYYRRAVQMAGSDPRYDRFTEDVGLRLQDAPQQGRSR